jgi:hypothetical protein
MSGAGRIRGTTDGGPLNGGAPRVVWQTLGADPRSVSAATAAGHLNELARACHLVWNPLQGETVQMIPILRAGRLLGQDATDEVAVASAEGRLCVQICVVAFARDPFTALPLSGLRPILDWLDSWGISRSWPAGAPAAYPDALRSCADRRLWARGGHFGASQVPGLTAAGPGAVDIERLTGRQAEAPRAESQVISEQAQGLDVYFGRDDAAVAGALSRVG